MKQTITKIMHFLQVNVLAFKLSVRVSRVYCLLYLFVEILRSLLPILMLLLWSSILDFLAGISASGQLTNASIVLVIAYILLQTLTSQLSSLSLFFRTIIEDTIENRISTQTMNKLAELDISIFDDPAKQDGIDVALNGSNNANDFLFWPVEFFKNIVSFATAIVVLLNFSSVLSVVLLFTYIPGAYYSYKIRKSLDQFSIDSIGESRKKNYYRSLLTTRRYAQDLRLYNLGGVFKNAYIKIVNVLRSKRNNLFSRGFIKVFWSSALCYIGFLLILLTAVIRTSSGLLTIGELVLYTGIAISVGTSFNQILETSGVHWNIVTPRLVNYLEFLEWESSVPDLGSRTLLNATPEIRFENVSFKYPNSERLVIDDLSFTISKGEKIALVGVNGAGKSTIVKLLLRLYDPTKGRVLVDGIDVKEYSLIDLRSIFGVCFQDVVRYSLTLAENIALSDIEKVNDKERIHKAMFNSGIEDLFLKLPNIDVPLTRSFDNNGYEPSGGEWQKVAIARAFFKETGIIILDEPSAALDPEAEDYIFRCFDKLCKDKGGVLISHRLSNVMTVDKIIVIEKGKLIEEGTHEKLIAKNGRYAYLYNLQAEKYLAQG